MKRKTRVSFGDNILKIRLPKSWNDLSQEELKRTCIILTTYDSDIVKVAIFCMLAQIRILRNIDNITYLCRVKLSRNTIVQFQLSAIDVDDLIKILDWVDSPPDVPVRLEKLRNFKACDANFHSLSFYDYLKCENLFHGFLESKNDSAVISIANILYQGNFNKLSQHEIYAVTLWFTAVKKLFSRKFSNFLKPVDTSEDIIIDMEEIMNAQIRALTGGDITKEKEIFNMDCWRALTELDAKAREVEEYNSKISK